MKAIDRIKTQAIRKLLQKFEASNPGQVVPGGWELLAREIIKLEESSESIQSLDGR